MFHNHPRSRPAQQSIALGARHSRNTPFRTNVRAHAHVARALVRHDILAFGLNGVVCAERRC